MSEYWNANISRVIKVNGKYIPIADDKFLDFVTATAGDIASGKTGADEHGYPVFGTYKPSGGTFDLAKVTEFSPYVEAMSGLSQIVVSGLGDDYDSANGTYIVTAETEKESDIFKRIYQHTSGEWFIWGEYEPENEEGYWYIGPAMDSGLFVCYTADELTDDTYYFENWDSGDSYDLTLDVTKTDYPETPMVLKGVMATGYVNKKWSFDNKVISFTGFETTPRPGNIYAISGTALIGAAISNDAKGDFSSDSALFALDSWRSLNDLVSGNAPTGIGVTDSNLVLTDGVFCFDHVKALQYPIGDSMSALADFTIEMDYTITGDYGSGYYGFFGNRTTWSSDNVCVQWRRNGYRPTLHWNGVADGLTGGNEHPEWVNDGKYHHLALVKSSHKVYLFSDGVLIGTTDNAPATCNLAYEGFLTVGTQRVENDILPGRMKHFRVVPFALYTEDFSNSLPSWVGA